MKMIIDIPWQIKECLNNENEWTALLLAELKEVINNGTSIEDPKTDILDKIRAEINKYGSLCVAYKIKGHSDRDIEKIVEDVMKQAKQQVLEIIDKYKAESEG